MKKILFFLFLAVAVLAGSASVYAAVFTLGFENYVPGTNTYYQGSVPADIDEDEYAYTYPMAFKTAAGKITLNSDWADWGIYYEPYFPYWAWNGGFTISNISAENTTEPRTVTGTTGKIESNGNYVYSGNQYAAVAGTTNYPNDGYGVTVSGANSSDSYAILFGSSYRGVTGGTITFEMPVDIQALSYTNALGALNIVTFGDSFSAKASNGNWQALIVQGIDEEGKLTGNQVLMLADYLQGNSIVTDWQTADFADVTTKVYDAAYYGVDESSADYQALKQNVESGQTDDYLGNPILADFGDFEGVKSLLFYFDGSDEGQWGFNFPVYAALDNLVFFADVPDPNAVPEPAAWALLALGFLGLGAVRKQNKK